MTETATSTMQRLTAILGAEHGKDSSRVAFVRSPASLTLMGDALEDLAGFVLAVSVEPETWLAFRPRSDGLVRLAGYVSGSTKEAGSFRINTLAPETRPSRRTWLDHAAGMAWSMREAGLPIHGFDGVVESAVAPWSFSATGVAEAAVETAVGFALLGACGVPAPNVIAALAQRAEREYVDVPGQIAGSLMAAGGQAAKAILLDGRSLDSRFALLPPGLSIVVARVESRVSAEDHADLLRRRRLECGRAVLLLAERIPGLASLRELDLAAIRRNRRHLPDQLARRLAHFVSENSRVLATAGALETGDLDGVGRLFAEAENSARTLYEIGSPEQAAMVETVRRVRGVVASRTICSGPDCTLNLVLNDAVPAAIKAIEEVFPAKTRRAATAYRIGIVNGASLAS